MSATTVSVVVTVRDEAGSIAVLLTSLAAQGCLPDEIVIVDGGSTDATPAILAAWETRLPLRVLIRPGANISTGRNVGIAAARGAIVAITDAGVRLAPDWLAALLALFEADPATQVVGGFFAPDPRTPFELALGATTLPTHADVSPETFLPSSRSLALRRAAWERVGGYPEWLDYCEDLIFDLKLREACGPFAFAPAALAYFRPRPTLGAFWHQYFRYARGDGKAGIFARRHAIRYATYLGLGAFLARGWRYPVLWPLVLLAGVGYLRRPYARLAPDLAPLSPSGRVRALAAVPLIRLVGDLAKCAGYTVGLWWRWRRYGPRRNWRAIEALERERRAGREAI